jgi:hypothetical protein
VDTVDHDILIGLKAEVVGLHMIIEAHNIASVERDTRIETVVNETNGTVKIHSAKLLVHEQVPHSGVDSVESHEIIAEHYEMWNAWKIGRWVGSAAALAFLGQTAALLVIVLRGGV